MWPFHPLASKSYHNVFHVFCICSARPVVFSTIPGFIWILSHWSEEVWVRPKTNQTSQDSPLLHRHWNRKKKRHSQSKRVQNIKKEKTSRKNEEAGAIAINPNWPPLNTDEKKRVKNFYLKVNGSAYTANTYSQSAVKVYSVNCNSAAVMVSILSVNVKKVWRRRCYCRQLATIEHWRKKCVKNFYLKVNGSAYTANINSKSAVKVQLIQCKVYSVNCNSAAVMVYCLFGWIRSELDWISKVQRKYYTGNFGQS